MRNGFTKFFCGTALTLFVSLGQSHADIIVSNLADPVDGTGTVYASGPPQFYAQEFETGSQSVELGSIIANVGEAAGSFTASAELVVNSGDLPGSTILTGFTVPAIGSSLSDLTFTPTSSVTLSANTPYWFVLEASGTTGSYKWAYTNTLSPSLPNYAVSNNSGASWTIGTPPGPFLIEADSVTAIPEPSTFRLVGAVGLLGFVVVLSRRLRRGQAVISASN
jgi:hypothetical protein